MLHAEKTKIQVEAYLQTKELCLKNCQKVYFRGEGFSLISSREKQYTKTHSKNIFGSFLKNSSLQKYFDL